MRWFGILMLALLLGCEARLEREGVPLWVEVRYQEQSLAEVRQQVAALAEAGYSQVLVTIPLEADARGLPQLPSQVVRDLAQPLRFDSLPLPYGVAFTMLHPDSLFPPEVPRNDIRWMHTLDSLVRRSGRLGLVQSPRLLVLGHHFVPLEDSPALWANLVDSLRPHFPGVPLLYSTEAERLAQIAFWRHLDGVGVAVTHGLDGQYKVHARASHREMARWLPPDKPLLLTRLNLIGADKTLKFRNALRFWPDSLAVQGAVLNTIFATPAPLDTFQTYFGFRGDDELNRYLRRYQSGR